ncbi:MAG: hypothetical protein GY789_20690 [Hyphomicrobiales bacterium]|nr:hypothetical protein [Hyphomicrobiales bacterium]
MSDEDANFEHLLSKKSFTGLVGMFCYRALTKSDVYDQIIRGAAEELSAEFDISTKKALNFIGKKSEPMLEELLNDDQKRSRFLLVMEKEQPHFEQKTDRK